MLVSLCVKSMFGLARCLGLGALVAALPLSMTASTVTAGFNFLLEGLPGSVTATYDSSTVPLTDLTGTYLDASDGLDSLVVTWDGGTFTAPEALDYSTLPELLLPGNSLVPDGSYGFLGDWIVSGSVSGGTAEILGVSANVPAYLATDVTKADLNGSPSTVLYLGLDAGSVAYGSVVTPEPGLLPVFVLGLAGLWFARRRKAIL